ncbi:MAG: SDR family NAD(P)-dependent oxidoreductase [Burkholderiales bacterium]|nr:SDR family NAD(P)-dependent oxidoreductase [Burkholderiales bacterium]
MTLDPGSATTPAASIPLPHTVLVTGAAGGIGSAIVTALALAGVRVTATDRSSPGPALAGLANVAWLQADMTSAADRARIVGAAGPRVEGVVHAAGLIDGAPWDAMEEEAIQRILSVNVVSPALLLRDLGPALADGGAVVLVGSIAARRASPNALFYAASKAALHSVGASLAVALAGRGIRVNVLAPGLIDTPLTDQLNDRLAREAGRPPDEVARARAQGIPAGRLGSPDDIAALCLQLLSGASGYVSGATLFATGGVLAGAI